MAAPVVAWGRGGGTVEEHAWGGEGVHREGRSPPTDRLGALHALQKEAASSASAPISVAPGCTASCGCGRSKEEKPP